MSLEFDEFFTNTIGELQFPFLFVKDASDDLAVTLNSMKKGDFPILIDYKGKLTEIYKIQKQPLYLKRLIVLFECLIFENKNKYTEMTCPSDLIKIESLELNRLYS